MGNETGRPTVVLDVGALLGSLVGQNESNVRAALELAEAMANCVLFCAEIEKALAGARSSGETDSGGRMRRVVQEPGVYWPSQKNRHRSLPWLE